MNLRGVEEEEEEEEVIAVDSLEEPSLEEEEDEGGEANGLNIRDEAAEAAISETSTAAQREREREREAWRLGRISLSSSLLVALFSQL